MRHLAVMLALSAAACLRPANKQTGYLVNGAVAGIGAVMVVGAEQRDCDGMDLGRSIGCGIGKEGGRIMGVSLIALGALGLVLTAASDAPDKP